MTTATESGPGAAIVAAPGATAGIPPRGRSSLVRPGSSGRVSGLTLGVVVTWLSVIVLLPIAALTVQKVLGVTSRPDCWMRAFSVRLACF